MIAIIWRLLIFVADAALDVVEADSLTSQIACHGSLDPTTRKCLVADLESRDVNAILLPLKPLRPELDILQIDGPTREFRKTLKGQNERQAATMIQWSSRSCRSRSSTSSEAVNRVVLPMIWCDCVFKRTFSLLVCYLSLYTLSILAMVNRLPT